MKCSCGNRDAWRVALRHEGFPAFGGHVRRPTESSFVVCDWQHGGCGEGWRTSATYVEALPDYVPGEPAPRVCQKCGRGEAPDNPLIPTSGGPEFHPRTGIQREGYRYMHSDALSGCAPVSDGEAQMIRAHLRRRGVFA